MLLNNYKKLFVAMQTQATQTLTNMNNGNSTGGQTNSSKCVTGNSMVTPNNLLTLTAAQSCIDVGFGDTPETPDDYILADGNAQNAKLRVANNGRNNAGIGDIINSYVNFRNDGASSVTVKEIGFYSNASTSASSSGSNSCLLIRKVLDTPVTIAPGETYSFTFVLRFKN